MKKSKRIGGLAAGVFGALLFAAAAPAQDRDEGAPIKLRTPIRFNPFGFGSGMTPVDPPSTDGKPNEDGPSASPPIVPEPKPALVRIEPTATGKSPLLDGSFGSGLNSAPVPSGCRTTPVPFGHRTIVVPSGSFSIFVPLDDHYWTIIIKHDHLCQSVTNVMSDPISCPSV